MSEEIADVLVPIVFMLLFFASVVLFIGEPDLLDAIIQRLMKG